MRRPSLRSRVSLIVCHVLAPPDSRQDVVLFGVELGRDQAEDRLADHFVSRVAKDPLGCGVPAPYRAVNILADDRVVGRIDNGREAVGLFGDLRRRRRSLLRRHLGFDRRVLCSHPCVARLVRLTLSQAKGPESAFSQGCGADADRHEQQQADNGEQAVVPVEAEEEKPSGNRAESYGKERGPEAQPPSREKDRPEKRDEGEAVAEDRLKEDARQRRHATTTAAAPYRRRRESPGRGTQAVMARPG